MRGEMTEHTQFRHQWPSQHPLRGQRYPPLPHTKSTERQIANVMSTNGENGIGYTQKTGRFMKNIIAKSLLLGFILLTFPVANGAELDGRKSIVYQLYGDFGWSAIFDVSVDTERYFGKPIEEQSLDILSKFFSPELANLFLKEAKCKQARKGELCNLEFDPIFASQDPAAMEMSISSAEGDNIAVEFIYPPNKTKINLMYHLEKIDDEWRISDIVYLGDNASSLKAILSR